jgi:hypothetical protein
MRLNQALEDVASTNFGCWTSRLRRAVSMKRLMI